MKTVTEKAYGKINLYLDVMGKRDDGYHNILSVMHTVGLYDAVTVSRSENGIKMSCSDTSLSCGEDNLCVKAARKFFEAANIHGGCEIYLDKILPMGAGMGGGSADAAAVLRALNTLYEASLTTDDLCRIGVKIGADVPFCVVGGCKKAEGIGEILTDFPSMPECFLIICEGGKKVSTPEAYRQIDRTPASQKGDFEGLRHNMINGSLEGICGSLYNRFEDTYSDCEKMKRLLMDNDARGALMTGSGSAVFGVFESEYQAEKAQKVLEKSGIRSFITSPYSNA